MKRSSHLMETDLCFGLIFPLSVKQMAYMTQ